MSGAAGDERKRLGDLGFDNGDAMISLCKLTGKEIADIALGPVEIRGMGLVYAIYRVDFTDGTHLNADADRDIPYLAPGGGLTQPGFESEALAALHAEWIGDGEDG